MNANEVKILIYIKYVHSEIKTSTNQGTSNVRNYRVTK